MFVYYPSPSTKQSVPQDLSTYAGGALEFAIRRGADVSVEMGWWPKGASEELHARVDTKGLPDQGGSPEWRQISIPLCQFAGVDLSVVTTLVTFAVDGSTTSEACVDAVRFRRGMSCPEYCNRGAEAGVEPMPDALAQPKDTASVDVPSTSMDAEGGFSPVDSSGSEVLRSCGMDLCSPGDLGQGDFLGAYLDCEQDLPLDQAGGGQIGLWTELTSGARILSSPSRTPFEGGNAICTQVTQGSASSFLYIPSSSSGKTINLSAYSGGFLECAVASDVPLQVGMSWLPVGGGAESRRLVSASKYVVGQGPNGWSQLRIPLCAFGANLASVVAIATFTIDAPSGATTFCWDAVRIRKPSAVCKPTCTHAATNGSAAGVHGPLPAGEKG